MVGPWRLPDAHRSRSHGMGRVIASARVRSPQGESTAVSEQFDQLNAALAGRYAIQRMLGVGGMGTVFLADDLRHRRPVAIKVLNAELAAVLGTERFLREIEIAAGLNHPHVLPLYDSGAANGLLYYVMPYAENE